LNLPGADWLTTNSYAAIGFIKATIRFENVSISLKTYLKSLAILEKALISLEKSSKII
jgi:hypothetical protein